MRRLKNIFLLLGLSAALGCLGQGVTEVSCGSVIQISATPLSGYRFARWSDGSIDSVRFVEIYSDTILIAYFAPNCGDYAALPLVNRYDWILMLHVKAITEMGYTLSPDRVMWYRVVGDPDSVDDTETSDSPDAYIGSGYSFTLDENLQNSGVYYAVVDLMADDGLECYGLSRTEMISFISTKQPARELKLLPNHTIPNGTMRLVGLNPDISTTIRVYSVTGKLLLETSTLGVEEYLLTAFPNTGVYEVQVLSSEDNMVLRYLVRQ